MVEDGQYKPLVYEKTLKEARVFMLNMNSNAKNSKWTILWENFQNLIFCVVVACSYSFLLFCHYVLLDVLMC